jgi:hypothetical protein
MEALGFKLGFCESSSDMLGSDAISFITKKIKVAP